MRTPRLMERTAALFLLLAVDCAKAFQAQQQAVHEGCVPVAKTCLYVREIGQGPPMVVIHGGPDFDHNYLLPEFDRLADSFHLVYYDQRGRGRSVDRVRPEEVTMNSEIEDLDTIRQHFRFGAPALLGHSWGAVIAVEYALQHPERVSRLILMNPAPVSASDHQLMRKEYARALGSDMDRQRAMVAGPAYQRADPEAVIARYRIHFKRALARPDDYEKLMTRMKAAFVRQGSAGILKARAVEDRLMNGTWDRSDYDLLPKLRTLNVPTLVIYGDHDFIPVEISTHIVSAVPKASLVTLENCGHFSYLECPADVHNVLNDFFRRTLGAGRAR